EPGGAAASGLWAQIVAAGFDRAAAPESAGGAALGWRDFRPLIEAVGAFAMPVPLAETLAAHALAARIGCVLPEGAASIARVLPLGAGWPAHAVAWGGRGGAGRAGSGEGARV